MNLRWSHFDSGWKVNQVSENLACLGIGIAPHTVGEKPVKSACDNKKREIKIDFERDCRGKCIHVEKSNRIRKGVFNEHALRIAGNEPLGAFCSLIGQKNRGLLMAKILDKKLAVGVFCHRDRLFEHTRRAIFSGDMIEVYHTPSRSRKCLYFGKQSFVATAQGDKGDVEGIETCKPCVCGELGVEDQFARQLAGVMFFEKIEKAEDLLGLFPFADIGIGGYPPRYL